MYVIGFCETLVDLLNQNNVRLFGLSNIDEIRIFGLITNTILILIALIGMGWESKVQLFLLVTLFVAFGNFLIGSFIPPSKEQMVKGFLGYKCLLAFFFFKFPILFKLYILISKFSS